MGFFVFYFRSREPAIRYSPRTPAIAASGSSLKQSTGLFLNVRPCSGLPLLSGLGFFCKKRKPCSGRAF